MSRGETAIVVGAGTGLGAALVRCFAGAGMTVAAALRNPGKLDPVIESLSGQARAYACDATDEDSVSGLFQSVSADLGEPGVVVYNAGAYVRGGILETTAEELERCWRVGCLGGFIVGQQAARIMAPQGKGKGKGTILFTGATASLRGGAGFHNLAVPKFGLRALSQSMARELGPQGIHVAHVIIDGQIMSDARAGLAKERPEDGLLDADAIARNYLDLHRQHPSAWTQELDLRPWVEKF